MNYRIMSIHNIFLTNSEITLTPSELGKAGERPFQYWSRFSGRGLLMIFLYSIRYLKIQNLKPFSARGVATPSKNPKV